MEPHLTRTDQSTGTAAIEPAPLIPWGWVRALLVVPAWILFQIALMIPVVSLLGLGGEIEDSELIVSPAGLIMQLAQLTATLAAVGLMRRTIDRRSFLSLGFSFDRSRARDLTAGLLGGIALISAVFAIIYAAGGVVIDSIQPPSLSFLVLALNMLIVAVNEEILVRGYMLSNLMSSTRGLTALLLSSLLFSTFHLSNPNNSFAGFVNIILAGLLLGIYYVHRRNLWFPIGLHLTWNLFQGGVYGSPVSGVGIESVIDIETTGHPLLTGGPFGFEASMVTSVMLAAAILVVHLIYRPRPEKPVGAD